MSWLAIRTWVRTNPATFLGIVGVIVLALAFGAVYLKGQSDQEKQERARDAVAVQAAIKSDTNANTKAAEVVVHDALARVAKEKELADAVAQIPDTVPDAVAVAAACRELLQAGVSTADLPACRAAAPRPPARAHR